MNNLFPPKYCCVLYWSAARVQLRKLYKAKTKRNGSVQNGLELIHPPGIYLPRAARLGPNRGRPTQGWQEGGAKSLTAPGRHPRRHRQFDPSPQAPPSVRAMYVWDVTPGRTTPEQQEGESPRPGAMLEQSQAVLPVSGVGSGTSPGSPLSPPLTAQTLTRAGPSDD